MDPSIALGFVIVGIAGLFVLDRERSARVSKALWLPLIWFCINGSRPVSVWFGMSPLKAPGAGARFLNSTELAASSWLDQAVAGVLMLMGFAVVARRGKAARAHLRASWPIVLYFAFGLISLVWSDFPDWGLKRWCRALGELTMALIVVTDAEPGAALRRLLSRAGFFLMPFSVLLIKYYPRLGQGFDMVWGTQRNVGVTTNKNTLGVVACIITLGTVWQILTLLLNKDRSGRNRRLAAQLTLLWFGIIVLIMAHSATAGICCVLGTALMVVTALPVMRRRPGTVHALIVCGLAAAGLIELLGGRAAAMRAIGRDPNLTGRTPIWNELIAIAPNPVGGAGFETFWMGPRIAYLDNLFPGINEAHNGYIEVYLNLGFIGVALIGLIIVQGYRSTMGAFRRGRDTALGSLLLAYIITAVAYSMAEAGFRMLCTSWFFLLVAVLAAGRMREAAPVKPPVPTRGRHPGRAWEASEPAPSWAAGFQPATAVEAGPDTQRRRRGLGRSADRPRRPGTRPASAAESGLDP